MDRTFGQYEIRSSSPVTVEFLKFESVLCLIKIHFGKKVNLADLEITFLV